LRAGEAPAQAGKERQVNETVVRRWVQEYRESEEAGLTPKRKPGNPLSIYQKRKELSQVEQLRYELALAQIEIAELKKARCKEWRDAQAKK
jgi:transposase